MLRRLAITLGITAALAACGGGGGMSPTENKGSPPATMTTMVQVGDDFFSPKSIHVSPGDTVQWTLVGQMTNHTVTDSGGAFDSGFLSSRGMTFSHTFSASDTGKTFNYFCQTHVSVGMTGDVQVGANAPPPKGGF